MSRRRDEQGSSGGRVSGAVIDGAATAMVAHVVGDDVCVGEWDDPESIARQRCLLAPAPIGTSVIRKLPEKMSS